MADDRLPFGAELRRRRTTAGMSLTELGRQVHYSKGHLSKVETGGKPPSVDLARRCDAALGCGGDLAALARRITPATPAGTTGDHDQVWMPGLGADGVVDIRVPSRGDPLRGADLAGGGRRAVYADPAALRFFCSNFFQLRRLGQHLGAPVMAPILVAHTSALRRLASDARAPQRDLALRLAARYAEYTGWLAQESGDDEQALWWTGWSVELASAGGHPDLAAYADVRRALLTLYRHDAPQTVALAQRAQAATTHPRVLGLAAQREAQGHALAGDFSACMRALERGAESLARDRPDAEPVLGSPHLPDPVTLVTGWCLVDLGRPARAVDLLRRGLAPVPSHAWRARARYGARLALAYASTDEAEQACATVNSVLDTYERIGSATVRADLTRLAGMLNRWHRHRTVTQTRLRLVQALSAMP